MLPYFLRSWHVTLQTQAGATYTLASGPDETLRVKFEIETIIMTEAWTCVLSIYNLAKTTATSILSTAPTPQNPWTYAVPIGAGDIVTVSAGYSYSNSGAFNPNSNVIYKGAVLQAIWERGETLADTVLVLRCINSLAQNMLNFVNKSVAPGATDLDLANNIGTSAGLTLNIDSDSAAALGKNQYSRGQVLRGRPYQLLEPLLKQNALFGWIDSRIAQDQLNIAKPSASWFSG